MYFNSDFYLLIYNLKVYFRCHQRQLNRLIIVNMPDTKTIKKAIRISYDFGLRGDYKGLYTWLDNHDALDCGQGLAFLKYKANAETSSKDLMNQVLKELKQAVKLNKSDRIYIICKDSESKKVKGDFMNGSRKAAPWEGYGDLEGQNIEDEGE
jgi:hypothetical protein